MMDSCHHAVGSMWHFAWSCVLLMTTSSRKCLAGLLISSRMSGSLLSIVRRVCCPVLMISRTSQDPVMMIFSELLLTPIIMSLTYPVHTSTKAQLYNAGSTTLWRSLAFVDDDVDLQVVHSSLC